MTGLRDKPVIVSGCFSSKLFKKVIKFKELFFVSIRENFLMSSLPNEMQNKKPEPVIKIKKYGKESTQ